MIAIFATPCDLRATHPMHGVGQFPYIHYVLQTTLQHAQWGCIWKGHTYIWRFWVNSRSVSVLAWRSRHQSINKRSSLSTQICFGADSVHNAQPAAWYLISVRNLLRVDDILDGQSGECVRQALDGGLLPARCVNLQVQKVQLDVRLGKTDS